MNFKLYSLHDKKMGMYLSPFVARNDVEAIRQLSGSMADPNLRNSPMVLTPGDFRLCCVGAFDDDNGLISAHLEPQMVVELSAVKPLGTVTS